MPQFDTICFFNLTIYSTLAFFLTYYGYKYYVLSQVARVLKMRRKMLAYTDWVNKTNGRDASKVLYSHVIKYYKN